jgi:hypothetical protein
VEYTKKFPERVNKVRGENRYTHLCNAGFRTYYWMDYSESSNTLDAAASPFLRTWTVTRIPAERLT